MFDFRNLEVYKKAKALSKEILHLLKQNKYLDPYLRSQLKRDLISIVINIAEGTGKFSKKDKANFYILSRGSVYKCFSLFEIILDEGGITKDKCKCFYEKYKNYI